MNIPRLPEALAIASDTFQVFDDFHWYISPQLWTSVLTDLGAVTVASAGGIASVAASDGTVADNDEGYIGTTASTFKPAANKPIYFEALVQWTEANTDDANVAVGLASSVAANLIVDDGAGLRASGAVIALYKVDGGTVWRFVTRNGSDVTDSVSTTTAGGSAYQKLSIEVIDARSTHATVVPRVDGALLKDSNGNVIRHELPLASIAACSLFAGVKNGGANLETLNVDYIGAVQTR